MSFIEDTNEMVRLGILDKDLAKKLLSANRAYVRRLKLQRKIIDKELTRILLEHAPKQNGKRRFDSKNNARLFNALLQKRKNIHITLYRRIGEKVDPEYSSP